MNALVAGVGYALPFNSSCGLRRWLIPFWVKGKEKRRPYVVGADLEVGGFITRLRNHQIMTRHRESNLGEIASLTSWSFGYSCGLLICRQSEVNPFAPRC